MSQNDADIEQAELQKERAERKLRRAERNLEEAKQQLRYYEELQRMEKAKADPGYDFFTFSARYARGGMSYTFVGARIGGKLYLTGNTSPTLVSWEHFVNWSRKTFVTMSPIADLTRSGKVVHGVLA